MLQAYISFLRCFRTSGTPVREIQVGKLRTSSAMGVKNKEIVSKFLEWRFDRPYLLVMLCWVGDGERIGCSKSEPFCETKFG